MLAVSMVILALYPQAWRDRYEAELRALLEDRQLTAGTVIDLLRGALDAHLEPGGLVPTPRERMRGTLAATLSCWIAFVLLGAAFAKATEDIPFQVAGHEHWLLGSTRRLIIPIAVLCGAVVVIAGAPLAYSVLRQAWRERTPALIRAVGVAVVAAAMLVVVTAGLVFYASSSSGYVPGAVNHGVGGSDTGHALFVVFGVVVVLVAIAGALAGRTGLMRTRLGLGQLVLGVAGAWLLARLMAALTLAVALYAVLLLLDSPHLASSPNGPLQLSTSMVLASGAVGMVLSSLLAVVTTRRGWRALRGA